MAGRIMLQLEIAGIVGIQKGDLAREVLIKDNLESERHLKSNILNIAYFHEQYKEEIEVKRNELRQIAMELKKFQIEKEYIKKRV